MKNKKIRMIIAALTLSTLTTLVGCTGKSMDNAKTEVKEDVNSAKNKVEQGVDKVENKMENATGNTPNNTTNNTPKDFTNDEVKFDKNTFVKDLKEKGFKTEKVSETDNNKKFFNADKEIIKINNEMLTIYEYNKDKKNVLENDIASIQDKGYTINGTKVTWNTAPHFYNKGRILVVYDGSNQELMKSLSEILGNPIMG